MQQASDVPSSAFEVGLWQDALELPESLAGTLTAADGFSEVAELLSHRSVRRIVVTGNGASYYVGLNLWLSSLMGSGDVPAEVVAIPAGLVATGHFAWRPGDALVAVSSSGEFRDVVNAALDKHGPSFRVAITSAPDSTLGTSVDARALVSVVGERAVTHTQGYCGALVASLAIWARLTSDIKLQQSLGQSIEELAARLAEARKWALERLVDIETPSSGVSFGSGPALAAAHEVALLMREVARLPWEGAETREGATSAMYALGPGQLVLAVGPDDGLLREAEAACAGSGATVLRLPGGEGDVRVAAITAFPSSLAMSIALARRGAHNVDRPSWVEGYYAMARPDAPGASDRAIETTDGIELGAGTALEGGQRTEP